MICKGLFIFKNIKRKDGGEFVNQQRQKDSYKPSYEVKFDDMVDGEAFERKIKVSEEEGDLIQILSTFKTYQKVIFDFDVGFNSKGITLKLIGASDKEAVQK